jgi:hypothetical protein
MRLVNLDPKYLRPRNFRDGPFSFWPRMQRKRVEPVVTAKRTDTGSVHIDGDRSMPPSTPQGGDMRIRVIQPSRARRNGASLPKQAGGRWRRAVPTTEERNGSEIRCHLPAGRESARCANVHVDRIALFGIVALPPIGWREERTAGRTRQQQCNAS